MSQKTESLASGPEFDSAGMVPDGFVGSVILIIFVMAVTLLVILRPARAFLLKYFKIKPNFSSDKTQAIDRIKLSSRTTLYKVKLEEIDVLVVESSLNASVTVIVDKLKIDESANAGYISGEAEK